MKRTAFFWIMAGIFSLFYLVSCDKNDDNNDNDEDIRLKYTGTWSCAEQSGLTYPVTIILDSTNSSRILIKNFHYFGANEKAYAIPTPSSLTIPSQEVCNNTVNGSGTLVNANKINLLYYVNNHSTIDTIRATYTR